MNGDESPPPELKLAWACERWGCLPEAGAYLDQSFRLMFRMTAFSNIYNAYSRYRNSHGKEIHTLSEGDRRILRMLKDEGVLFRG